MQAVVPLGHFLVIIEWDPEHEPEDVNDRSDDKKKSDLVVFVLREGGEQVIGLNLHRLDST